MPLSSPSSLTILSGCSSSWPRWSAGMRLSPPLSQQCLFENSESIVTRAPAAAVPFCVAFRRIDLEMRGLRLIDNHRKSTRCLATLPYPAFVLSDPVLFFARRCRKCIVFPVSCHRILFRLFPDIIQAYPPILYGHFSMTKHTSRVSETCTVIPDGRTFFTRFKYRLVLSGFGLMCNYLPQINSIWHLMVVLSLILLQHKPGVNRYHKKSRAIA